VIDFIAIVREFFPDATEDEAMSILWEYTGFPGFWAGDPAECVRAQLKHLKEVGADAIDAERDALAAQDAS